MANFDIAYGKTAKNEGGYTNNSKDNGNWTGGKVGSGILIGTNYGISAPVLMKFIGRVPTVDEMKNLSIDTVKKIYRKDYWNIIRGDEILIQEIGNSVYDSAVNMGAGTAIKLSQRALKMKETGKMDDATLNALNNKI